MSWIAHRAVSIAEVCIRARSRIPLERDVAAYLPFHISDGPVAECSSSLEIEVVTGLAPPNDSPVLYDNDGFWRVQTEGEGYRLGLCSRDDGEAYTVACSDATTTRVRVYKRETAGLEGMVTQRMSGGSIEVLDRLLLMNHLAFRGGVIVHAAGAIVNGQGLVFAGVSSAGKSTLSRLLVDVGFQSCLLGDDRVILRVGENGEDSVSGVGLWGTPWCGDLEISRNSGALCAALFFLVKASTTEAVAIDPAQAMRYLMPVASGPWYDRARGELVMHTCGRVVENIPCYELRFKPDKEVVRLLTGRLWAHKAQRHEKHTSPGR